METLKAGCILVNTKIKCVALVYRDYLNDYSFPKGHLEEGETFEECAVRETAEETKRIAIIDKGFEPIVERYTTPRGEKCVCYMYVAIDGGHSDNDSEDTHETLWIPYDEVENKLSYQDLKDMWNKVKDKIKTIIDM